MKNRTWHSLAICGMAMFILTNNTQAGAIALHSTTPYPVVKTSVEDPAAKANKKKRRSNTRLNNKAVKIYPDIIKREMHVVAKENNGKIVDFFVFDTEGAIVQQYKMSEREHKKITGLAPGKYTYRVFTGDTETTAGNFEIR
ncbi:MAG: hypothetical protein RL115_806 [Bacteroidota bacterium]|jgi:hypothetical protein